MNDEISFPRKWEFIFSSLDSQICQAERGSASRYKDVNKNKDADPSEANGRSKQVRHDKKTC
jgi:hypothetical protein